MKLNFILVGSLLCLSFISTDYVIGMKSGKTFPRVSEQNLNDDLAQIDESIQRQKQEVIQLLNTQGATSMPVFYKLVKNMLYSLTFEIPAEDLIPLLRELRRFGDAHPEVMNLSPDIFAFGGRLQREIVEHIGVTSDLSLDVSNSSRSTFYVIRNALSALEKNGVDFGLDDQLRNAQNHPLLVSELQNAFNRRRSNSEHAINRQLSKQQKDMIDDVYLHRAFVLFDKAVRENIFWQDVVANVSLKNQLIKELAPVINLSDGKRSELAKLYPDLFGNDSWFSNLLKQAVENNQDLTLSSNDIRKLNLILDKVSKDAKVEGTAIHDISRVKVFKQFVWTCQRGGLDISSLSLNKRILKELAPVITLSDEWNHPELAMLYPDLFGNNSRFSKLLKQAIENNQDLTLSSDDIRWLTQILDKIDKERR